MAARVMHNSASDRLCQQSVAAPCIHGVSAHRHRWQSSLSRLRDSARTALAQDIFK